MAEIETREEGQAVQIASDALDRYLDSYDREVFRAGWPAGRDWQRAQNADLLAALEAVTERIGSRQPCCPEARYSAAVHHADCPYLVATKLIARVKGQQS